MLNVHNLSKNFGSNNAVKNVSFNIQPGEIFSLIGPNSSGKTTIIKNILGLLSPTSGTVTIDGHIVEKDPLKAKAEVGYIPDEPAIWSYMTGEEFLHFTQALFAKKSQEHRESIQKLLAIFSLQGLEKQYFEDYSRGNKQKFSIIAALSHAPKVLLIDEPIVGLDPTGADIAKKLFVDFAKKGGAVLLVTHTLSVAEEISDRIGILKQGELVASGTMKELRELSGLTENATLDEIYKKLA